MGDTTDQAELPTEADWQQAANVLGAVSTLLDTVDWDALIALQDRTDSLGPILYPTEYRDALHSGRLGRNAMCLRATRDYLGTLRAIHAQTQGDRKL